MRTRWTGAAVAAAVLAGTAVGLVVTGGTSANGAAGPAPWEPQSKASGTITFYNATGAVIRSGSTNKAPFFAFAVGSKTLRAGDKKAVVELAAPKPGVNPASFFTDTLTDLTSYPLTTGPTDVKTLSRTQPVVTGAANNLTIEDFMSEVPAQTAAGYVNVFQVRLVSGDGQASPTYDDADIVVNKAAHTWTQVFPVQATRPGAPTAVHAAAHNGFATLSWKAPASNGNSPITGYTVQFSSNGGGIWKNAAGVTKTSTTVHNLKNGARYVFRVAAKNRVGTGAFSVKSVPVTPRADGSRVTIAGPAKVMKGRKVIVTGRLTDTATHKGIPGVLVGLWAKPAGKKTFHMVKRVKDKATGVVSFAVAPKVRTVYEWRYAGAALHKPAISGAHAVAVKVPPHKKKHRK